MPLAPARSAAAATGSSTSTGAVPAAAASARCAVHPLEQVAQPLAQERVHIAAALSAAALLWHDGSRGTASAAVVSRQAPTRRVKRHKGAGGLPKPPRPAVPRLLAASRRGEPRAKRQTPLATGDPRWSGGGATAGAHVRHSAGPPKREARWRGARAGGARRGVARGDGGDSGGTERRVEARAPQRTRRRREARPRRPPSCRLGNLEERRERRARLWPGTTSGLSRPS